MYVRPVSKKNLLRNITSLSNILAGSSKTRPSEMIVLAKFESIGVASSNSAGISLSEALVMMDRWREVGLRESRRSWY